MESIKFTFGLPTTLLTPLWLHLLPLSFPFRKTNSLSQNRSRWACYGARVTYFTPADLLFLRDEVRLTSS